MTIASESFDQLLNAGKAALRSGDRARATALLARAVRLDPHSEQAWLFLAGAVSDPAQRRTCLERVLSLNPQNQAARQGLRSLASPAPAPAPRPAPQPPAAPPPPVAASADQVLALLSSRAEQPPAAPPPALEPAPATSTTIRLPPAFVPLPAAPAPAARRTPTDRLVWSLILALGILMMLGSAVYAILLVRG